MQLPPLALLCWLLLSPILALQNNRVARALGSPLVFCLIGGALTLLLRWPGIASPLWLNFDESNIIAEALRSLHHPIPWTGFDTSSSGPLNAYALLPFSGFSGPITLAHARLAGIACGIIAWILCYLATRNWVGDFCARLGMALPLLFLATTTHGEFVHFSSEQFPAVLLAASFWLFSCATVQARPGRQTLLCLLSIAAASLLPLTKMQATPIALTQAAIALGYCLWRNPGRRLPTLGWCVLAGVTLPAIILAPTLLFGNIADFWNQYILFSLSYRVGAFENFAEGYTPVTLPGLMLSLADDFALYASLVGVTAALAVGALLWGKAQASVKRLHLLWIALVVPVTVFCVLAPNKPFGHYLYFLLFPLGIIATAAVSLLVDAFGERVSQARLLVPLLLGLLLWPMVHSHVVSAQPRAPRPPAGYNEQRPELIVAGIASRHPGPEDSLAIWGFCPEVFVLSQLRPATPMLIGQPNFSCPLLPWFKQRFITELRSEKPRFFLDCVAPGMPFVGPFIRDPHEAEPDLAAYVRDNYRLVWAGRFKADQAPVRLYERIP